MIRNWFQVASEHQNEEIRVFEMDAQSLPFPVGFFDVVILFEAIYYLSQPEDFPSRGISGTTPRGESAYLQCEL